jgi:hypothetical protein
MSGARMLDRRHARGLIRKLDLIESHIKASRELVVGNDELKPTRGDGHLGRESLVHLRGDVISAFSASLGLSSSRKAGMCVSRHRAATVTRVIQ